MAQLVRTSRQAIPSRFPRHPKQSEYPHYWRSLLLASVPSFSPRAAVLPDLSGRTNTGTLRVPDGINNMWSAGDPLHPGANVRLRSSSDDVRYPSQPVGNIIKDTWTIFFRVRAGAIADRPTFGFLIGTNNNADNPFCSFDGNLNFGDGVGFQTMTALPNSPAEEYADYAIVDDGGDYIVYFNGTEIDRAAITTSPANSANLQFVFGQSGFSGAGFQDHFFGRFDTLYWYGRPLDREELLFLHEQPRAPFIPKKQFWTVAANLILLPDPITPVWNVPTPAVNKIILTPTPAKIAYQVQTPSLFLSILTPQPVKAAWRAQTPSVAVPVANPRPVTVKWKAVAPSLKLTQRLREQDLTATALAKVNQNFVKGDWLIEAPEIGLQLSYDFNPDGTWEHRILNISDVEISVKPGGGLATVGNLTVTVVEDGSGQSLRRLWERSGKLQGATITLKLLLEGEVFADAIVIFSGQIDDVTSKDGRSTILASEDSIQRNIKIPQGIVNIADFPDAAPAYVARIIPLVYGAGSAVKLMPLLLTDQISHVYLAASHALQSVASVTYGIYDEATNRAKERGERNPAIAASFGDATLSIDFSAAKLTLDAPLSTKQMGQERPSLSIEREQDVTSSENILNLNTTIRALLNTDTFTNADGDGNGFIGVAASFASALGINTLEIDFVRHNRGPDSLTTVTGQLEVRLIDESGGVLQDGLLVTQEFRHKSNPRSNRFHLRPITFTSNERVELFINAINEGGLGTASDFYAVGLVSVVGWHTVEGEEKQLYLVNTWNGRIDNVSGVITGIAEGLIRKFPDVIRSILVTEMGLSINTESFDSARTLRDVWFCDGGIGHNWSQEQIDARQLLDQLARYSASTLFPGFDGDWKDKPFTGQDAPTVFDFDETNILYTSIGGEPHSRPSSFKVKLGPLSTVHNDFEIRYAFNPGSKSYDKIKFCNNDASNSTDPFLILFSKSSFRRYGTRPPLIIEVPWIYEDSVAELFLDHVVKYFYSQRLFVSWETSLAAINVELGDMVTIDHPHIPINDRGKAYEVHKIRYIPSRGTIQFQASRVALFTEIVKPAPPSIQTSVPTPLVWNEAMGDFAAVDSHFTLNDGLKGATDSRIGTLSVWLELDGDGNVAQQHIMRNARSTPTLENGMFVLYSTASALFRVFLGGVGQTFIDFTTSNFPVSEPQPHHLFVAWDFESTASVFQIYIDGILEASTTPTISNGAVLWAFSDGNTFVGTGNESTPETQKWSGCMGEFYLNISAYIDPSVSANLEKFIKDGHPITLGVSGERPTGESPIMHFVGTDSALASNLGTGSAFTGGSGIQACPVRPRL